MAAQEITFAPSTHLKGLSYDPDSQQLAAVFDNGTYVYDGVPQDVADGFATAPSAGSYLHQMVKGKYPYTKK